MGVSDYQQGREIVLPPGDGEVVLQPAATGYFVRTDNQYQDILCRLADGGVYIYHRDQRREIFIPQQLIEAYCG